MTKRSSKAKKGKGEHFKNASLVPPSLCTGCGRILDLAFSYNEEEPSPGVLTICDRCGEIMILDDDLMARAASQEEIDAAKENPEIYDMLIYFSSLIKMRRQAPNN